MPNQLKKERLGCSKGQNSWLLSQVRRLQQLSINQRERLATEAAKEGEARLQQLSINQRERLATIWQAVCNKIKISRYVPYSIALRTLQRSVM